MSIVVGVASDTRSRSGLELASEIARTAGDPIVLTCVVQDSWESLHDFAGVDDEWRQQMTREADDALIEARRELDPQVTSEVVRRADRSVPRALAAEAVDRGARLIVAGSSRNGPLGHIALGSTTDHLVHSANLPVAVAPRGYRAHGRTVGRLVMAVDPTRADVALTEQVAELAVWLRCPVDVVTFAVRSASRTAFTVFADQGVQDAWRASVREHHDQIVTGLRAHHRELVVSSTPGATGDRWSRALESYPWNPGDLLVVGSSEHGPVARVFLGSTAARIMRYSPVPVVLLPRR